MGWFEELNELERRAAAEGRTRRQATSALDLPKQTVHGWFNQHIAPEFDSVWKLIAYYLGPESAAPGTQKYWADLHETARGSRRRAAPADGGWPDLVRAHPLWECVPDPAALREPAARLAGEWGIGWSATTGDPWHDPALPGRWLDRVATLALWAGLSELSAAEASLLTLLPLLQLAHQARAGAVLGPLVHPDSLAADAPAGPERNSFRGYLLGHPWLVRRAEARDLPGRRPAAHEIGQWLLRRWTLEKRPVDPELVAGLSEPAEPALRVLLGRGRATALLRVLRFGPARLAEDDAGGLASGEHLDLPGLYQDQSVRLRLLGLLLACTRPLALDAADLPAVLVEHLGIPDAVDLAQVRTRLEQARWYREGPAGAPRDCVLEAVCDHPATLLALREHTEAVDHTLRAVHRAAARHDSLAPLRRLPTAALGRLDPAAAFSTRTARFTVDERRLRELLMGDQLYGDPALALRELYQNALDACRYRRARLEYRFRGPDLAVPPDLYRGEISFLQDVDEDGRAYVECRDNGVGMGEEEITGVFSQAGVSFTGTEEFAEERAEWEQHGIRLFPNSRFGIGVLSYFMLADEIRVTTCRTHRRPDRELGPVLRATIAGPGHLFRIEYPEEPATPHTAVRLYLREGVLTRSCVDVLQDLVAVSEFVLTAEDRTEDRPRRHEWTPWEYTRAAPERRWDDRPQAAPVHAARQPDGQVIWSAGADEILVDGIRTERPPKRAGLGISEPVLGAVVNLFGPQQVALSVDRKRIMEDVSARVTDLLRRGVGELVGSTSGVFSLDWVARLRPEIADLVTREAVDQRRTERVGRRVLDLGATGIFGPDQSLAGVDRGGSAYRAAAGTQLNESSHPVLGLPDQIFLWRLLALGMLDEYPQLASAVDPRTVGPVAPAFPSDVTLLAGKEGWLSEADFRGPWRILSAARDVGWPLHRTARRLAELGLLTGRSTVLAEPRELDGTDLEMLNARVWSGSREPWCCDVAGLLTLARRFQRGLHELADRLTWLGYRVELPESAPDEPDRLDLLILSSDLSGDYLWLPADRPVALGHLVAVSERTGLAFEEIANRLARYGYACPSLSLPGGRTAAEEGDTVLFSAASDRLVVWLDPAEPVHPVHVVLAADHLGVETSEVVERMAAYGFRTRDLHRVRSAEPIDPGVVATGRDGGPPWLDLRRPVSGRHVVAASYSADLPIGEVVGELERFGYRLPRRLRELSEGDEALLLELHHHEEEEATPYEDSTDIAAFQHVVRRFGLSPETVLERLAGLGVTVLHGKALTRDAPHVDLNLLSRNLDQKAPWYHPGDRVPYARVVLCALTLDLPVEQVAARMRGYGLDARVPGDDHPDRSDLVLISANLDGREPWLPVDTRYGLGRLATAARALNRPLAGTAARLRRLGFEVGDPAAMVDAALARVPWQREEPS
ncbi:hypothetical protein ACFYNO_13825 [Kitasatospora sp. NPDC006697]|uniref:wHTH domain-containing protein n=1 Tax=Kitasatospora sp. NPDC006697 TaxID=3364020 RepID=UPI00369C659A